MRGDEESHVSPWLDTCEAEEFEHAIDGVEGKVDEVAFGVGEPGEFSGSGEADASWCPGCTSENSAASKALGVDDKVVASLSEAVEPGEGGPRVAA